MRNLFSKRIILPLLTLFIFSLIVLLTYLLFVQKIGSKREIQDTEIIISEVLSNLEKYGNHFNKVQTQEALDKLNNESLSNSDRYKALESLAFYFKTAYAASHKPELREYLNTLNKFAKENFPEFYNEAFFIAGCADPSCGEKPDDEITKIQKEINNAGIPIEYLNTINKNLEQAIYIPNEQVDDKRYGFGLVLEQLEFQNIPKASAAAERLKGYLKTKYSFEYKPIGNKEPAAL